MVSWRGSSGLSRLAARLPEWDALPLRTRHSVIYARILVLWRHVKVEVDFAEHPQHRLLKDSRKANDFERGPSGRLIYTMGVVLQDLFKLTGCPCEDDGNPDPVEVVHDGLEHLRAGSVDKAHAAEVDEQVAERKREPGGVEVHALLSGVEQLTRRRS